MYVKIFNQNSIGVQSQVEVKHSSNPDSIGDNLVASFSYFSSLLPVRPKGGLIRGSSLYSDV